MNVGRVSTSISWMIADCSLRACLGMVFSWAEWFLNSIFSSVIN